MSNELALQRVFQVLQEAKNDLADIHSTDETKTISEARNTAWNGLVKIARFYKEVSDGAAEWEAKQASKN